MRRCDIYQEALTRYIQQFEKCFAEELADTKDLQPGEFHTIYGPLFNIFGQDEVVIDSRDLANRRAA